MKLDIGYSKVDKTKNVSHYFQLILIISLLGFGLLHAHDLETGGHKSSSKSPPTKSSQNKKPLNQNILQSQKSTTTSTTTTTASVPKNPQSKSPPAQKPPSRPDLDCGMFLKIIKLFCKELTILAKIKLYSGIQSRHFVYLFRWLGQLMSA